MQDSFLWQDRKTEEFSVSWTILFESYEHILIAPGIINDFLLLSNV